jgi:hypothetical protein
MNRTASLEECKPALQAIRSMGDDSLPFLLKNIQKGRPSKWENRLFELTDKSGILSRIVPNRMLLVSPTCLALRELGTNAASIIPDLDRLFLTSDAGGLASLALLSLGSNAAPSFAKGCQAENEEIRIKSALYLAKVIDGREDGWSWGWAAHPTSGEKQLVLGFVTLTDEDARVLANHLKHNNSEVRRASAEALKQHGRYDPSVENALKQAAVDEHPAVRQAVQDALFMFEIRKRN